MSGIVTRVESGAEIAEAIPFLGVNGQVSFDDLSDDFPELVFDLDIQELAGDMALFEGFGR
jgi:hypothetical protein